MRSNQKEEDEQFIVPNANKEVKLNRKCTFQINMNVNKI